jgi:5-formyltetrahydrofolate cyclo-ligase
MLAPQHVLDQKARMRREALERRDALAPDERAAAAESLAAQPFPVDLVPGIVVSGYAAIRSELNPLPLLRRLAQAGARLALPTIVGRGHALRFRAWEFGEPVVRGQWGIREPRPDAPEVFPDVVIAPLAAFDRQGNRIGYGAGYYDRTIDALRAMKSIVAIGVGYANQEVSAVPVLPHDVRLDLVLTEAGVIDCRVAPG